MKKNLLRAVLAASFSLFVAGALTAPSYAASSSAADAGPKLSKAFGKPLGEAQQALTAKDWPTALAKINEAKAIPDATDFDKYIINYFTGIADFNTGDKPGAAAAFALAAESPAVPEKERAQVLHNAISLNLDVKDNAKAVELGQFAMKLGVVDETIAGNVAIGYYRLNDYANAQLFAQKVVDLSAATGKIPERTALEIMLQIEISKKNIPGEGKVIEKMANFYGQPDDWANLIIVAFGTLPPSKSYLDVAVLYVSRLMLTVDAKTSADNYLLAAQAAESLRSPGDTLEALRVGLAKGVLSQSKVGAMQKKAEAAASHDKPTLAAADAVAAKSPTAKEDVSVAEDYYGYGNLDDAARVAQRAIGKRGSQAIEAQLLLGVVQARQGNNQAAAQSLALVKGDPALERAAYLWSLYATRKYGQAPAATPAAAH